LASGSPVNFEPTTIEPAGFLSRAVCQVFAVGMGQGAEGKKVTEREAVFWSGKLGKAQPLDFSDWRSITSRQNCRRESFL